MMLDRKLERTLSPKLESHQKQLSAFEMSLNLEFQVDPLPKGSTTPKAGDPCPQCQSAKIDYDSLLNLSCYDCDYTLAGCFT
jgi:hypothetical protein